MAPLANPKHETFCQLIVAGTSIPTAYTQAGFSPDPSNAGKLARKPAILARTQELRTEALNRQGISVERIIAATAAIAFADVRTLYDWNEEDGVMLRSASALTDAQAAAICQVTQTVYRGERKIKIQLADKQRALETLGRWAGLDAASRQPEEINVYVESPREIIAARLARLASRAKPVTTIIEGQLQADVACEISPE